MQNYLSPCRKVNSPGTRLENLFAQRIGARPVMQYGAE